MALFRVMRESELAEGMVRGALAGKKKVALARVGNKIYCFDHICPHMGGPLGEGAMEGNDVKCPWHGNKFDVKTGQCTTLPALKVAIFSVTVKDGDIYVEV
ncbi:MAG: Rieske 2Fe-2S domain-containing protein [Candidatus Micrarchaeia archaeon]|jgi:nitrite reductase/ring-hydroxylating ferredoxin subunit